ncbi:PDZ domain-containing protein [Sporosarcina luteola]|nr:PDZ domain-containing protein [Sporosarcina luteola]
MKMRRLGLYGLFLVVLIFMFFYPLNSYISKPGGAYDLAPLVEVAGGNDHETGTFNLMTVSIAKATPLSYLVARFSDDRKIMPVQKVRREGENDKEYNIRQRRLMSDSQFNAITVAFDRVGLPVDIQFDGVFVVMVLPGSAADTILEVGDKIRSIDGKKLTESGQFATLISEKKEGDQVDLSVERGDKQLGVTVALKEIPDSEGKIGLGIQFQEDRLLTTQPEVEFSTGEIGGPSAGLMFTLEIMNQLMEEDMTKGYQIAGTGEMLPDGTVGRIGGAEFKVMAASNDGIEIFFAPDDELSDEVRSANPGIKTNYEEAVEAAKKIGTTMKIVPVKTVDDALDYLKKLEPK